MRYRVQTKQLQQDGVHGGKLELLRSHTNWKVSGVKIDKGETYQLTLFPKLVSKVGFQSRLKNGFKTFFRK